MRSSRLTARETRVVRWASVTKLVTALAALVAAEEGVDRPGRARRPARLDGAAPARARVRPALRGGRGRPGQPGRRRVYSNVGFETLADRRSRAQAAMPFTDYLRAGVLEPLGMKAELRGSPAAYLYGSLDDLLLFASELQRPTLVAAGDARRGDDGAVPGPRRCAAGLRALRSERLGARLRAAGRQVAALDRDAELAADVRSFRRERHLPLGRSRARAWRSACLTDLEFGEWAKEAWPRLSDAVLVEEA